MEEVNKTKNLELGWTAKKILEIAKQDVQAAGTFFFREHLKVLNKKKKDLHKKLDLHKVEYVVKTDKETTNEFLFNFEKWFKGAANLYLFEESIKSVFMNIKLKSYKISLYLSLIKRLVTTNKKKEKAEIKTSLKFLFGEDLEKTLKGDFDDFIEDYIMINNYDTYLRALEHMFNVKMNKVKELKEAKNFVKYLNKEIEKISKLLKNTEYERTLKIIKDRDLEKNNITINKTINILKKSWFWSGAFSLECFKSMMSRGEVK